MRTVPLRSSDSLDTISVHEPNTYRGVWMVYYLTTMVIISSKKSIMVAYNWFNC